jgi:hypothetical protein
MKSTIRKPGVEAGIMNTPEYGPGFLFKQFKPTKKLFIIFVAPLQSIVRNRIKLNGENAKGNGVPHHV